MRRVLVMTCVVVLLLVLEVVRPVAARCEEAAATSFRENLYDLAGWTDKALRSLGDGVLVSQMPVADPTQQAAFAGLIRLDGEAEALLEGLLAGPGKVGDLPSREEGRFSEPAELSDLSGLEFPQGDFEVLAACKPAACKFKLNKDGISQARAIDWSRAEAPQLFADTFRAQAIEYVQRYRQEGNAGLIRYADKAKSISVEEGFEQLASEMRLFQAHLPGLLRYLKAYPKERPDGVSNRFQWTLREFGYRPTLAFDHVLIDRAPEQEGIESVLVYKLIYANHYLTARVQSWKVLEGESALGVPGRFALLIDRLLFDSKLGIVERGLLNVGLRDDVKLRMRAVRAIGG